MHLLELALIIEKACLRITLEQRLQGQSEIRISMYRLKLLLPLLKAKSLIHLDPSK